mmetsp:Transcript_126859/g.367187  ORF Transcript_126859/g.367187 Transcript_126859/m.367187 type:complete len:243 (-) Transcript_126859:927-1655(-)
MNALEKVVPVKCCHQTVVQGYCLLEASKRRILDDKVDVKHRSAQKDLASGSDRTPVDNAEERGRDAHQLRTAEEPQLQRVDEVFQATVAGPAEVGQRAQPLAVDARKQLPPKRRAEVRGHGPKVLGSVEDHRLSKVLSVLDLRIGWDPAIAHEDVQHVRVALEALLDGVGGSDDGASLADDRGPHNAAEQHAEDACPVLLVPHRVDVAIPDGGDRHHREVERRRIYMPWPARVVRRHLGAGK